MDQNKFQTENQVHFLNDIRKHMQQHVKQAEVLAALQSEKRTAKPGNKHR